MTAADREEIRALELLVAKAINAYRDLHRFYGNTSVCAGGIGGAAMTQHCGVTCHHDQNHEAEQDAWYRVELAYLRRVDGDPNWADYMDGAES